MARIDDLLNDISQPDLRAQLREQIAALKKGKEVWARLRAAPPRAAPSAECAASSRHARRAPKWCSQGDVYNSADQCTDGAVCT
jgi:hypothetical protein